MKEENCYLQSYASFLQVAECENDDVWNRIGDAKLAGESIYESVLNNYSKDFVVVGKNQYQRADYLR